MKKKLLLLGGIVVVALVVIMVLVNRNGSRNESQDENSLADYSGDYNWNYDDDETVVGSTNSGVDNSVDKSITITGINGITGYSNVSIYDDDGSWVAHGSNSFWGDTAEYLLYDSGPGFKRFTGSDSYIISLSFESDGWRYYYTNGETLKNLEVQSVDDISKLPKFTFDSAESTILFSHFKPMDYLGVGGK